MHRCRDVSLGVGDRMYALKVYSSILSNRYEFKEELRSDYMPLDEQLEKLLSYVFYYKIYN